MELIEARSASKSLYLLAASLAGLDVHPESSETLALIVSRGFEHVHQTPERRSEAVANLLRLIAMALEVTQDRKETVVHEANIKSASEKLCPVYPFG